MSSNVLFVSTKSGKAIFLTQREVLVKSYCSLSGTCSLENCFSSCSLFLIAKNYLRREVSSEPSNQASSRISSKKAGVISDKISGQIPSQASNQASNTTGDKISNISSNTSSNINSNINSKQILDPECNFNFKNPDFSVTALDGELSASIGEYRIAKKMLLEVMGLGSCIGVVLFDLSTGICGAAHILLPGASQKGETKYAETAIEKMLEDMVQQGANRNKIASKFAGGAQVFKHMSLDILKVGNRNAISVEETLLKNKIPILAKDTGGDVGRNVIFNPIDGSMIVKYTKPVREVCLWL
ncbi:MAG: hypothetical protein ACPK85_08320 [Methanosarcina sp.]